MLESVIQLSWCKSEYFIRASLCFLFDISRVSRMDECWTLELLNALLVLQRKYNISLIFKFPVRF